MSVEKEERWGGGTGASEEEQEWGEGPDASSRSS